MTVTVRIPTPLRSLTGGEDHVQVAGSSVQAVIDNLEAKHPGIKERLVDDKGVRRFVNLYLGEEDIRFLDGLETQLKDGDEISIVPAIAGG
jgi:sulfur-carrier protein